MKSKFGVSYKDVPARDFTAVLSLMSRVAVEGEYLPKPEPVNALHELPSKEQVLQDAIAEHLGRLRVIVSLDMEQKPNVTLIKPGALVFSAEELPDLIAKGGAQVPTSLLPRIIEAVAKRMTAQ